MEFFSEYDLIQAMSGPDEYDNSKCIVAIKQQRCDSNGHLADVDEEFISEKPIVQICKQLGGYILVDFLFRSVEDKDLNIIYSYLERFFRASNSVSDDEMDFPLLSLSVIPKEFDGEYWALGLNPIFYTLTPEESTGEPRIIRMVFLSQDDTDALPNFLFLRSPDAELEAIKEEDNFVQ